MNNNHLQVFDNTIQRCRNNSLTADELQNLKATLLRCILLIAEQSVQEREDWDKRVLHLLDNFRDVGQKKLLALCFARLLPEVSMRWVTENPWRPKVVHLLDSQFSDDLYGERKVEINLPAHEKVEKLARILEEHEQSFLNSLQMLTSLERMKAHRQKLMSTLNGGVGRLLLRPFLPDCIEASLNELYKCTENYLNQRDSLSVVDARAKVLQVLKQISEILEEKNTQYSTWILECIARKIYSLIEEDFAKNKAAQPAEVIVEVHEKKYPLHSLKKRIKLCFVLKNLGNGYAHETKLFVVANGTIELLNEEVDFGRVEPHSTQMIRVPVVVISSCEELEITMQVNWHNFDNTIHNNEFSFIIKSQRNDIDWEQLEQYEPYSLDPINSENELVGRKEVLNRLIAIAKAPNIGSSIIYGQKRVGKTSIAKALKSHLEGLNYLVIEIEAGTYVQATAKSTISSLGNKLCDRIRRIEPKFSHLSIPEFDDALSPLDTFLDNITQISPDSRIVIILDEFDQLPTELYLRNTLGNSFFLTLRSLSSRQGLGFVLIGGEKMSYVMDYQGMQLNKWKVFQVDYFTTEDLSVYQELVQRPVNGQIEYAEDGLIRLHEMTAGNPYFTKLVCQYVFQKAVENRDCHITKEEINDAIEVTTGASETDTNTFAHFWDDGIVEIGERAVEKSIHRRKILIALADALAEQSPAPDIAISKLPIVRSVPSIEVELKELVSRRVLISESQNNTFDFKVPLFYQWLRRRGTYSIIATFPDLDKTLQSRQEQEKLKIQSSEIVNLVKKWGTYRGQAVTEDRVRAWLDQFTNIQEQRAIFTLLEGLRYYSQGFVRQKMSEADGIVKRGLIRQLASKESRKFKQSDILVSYLDGAAKSGADFARLYADEASLYVDNVVEKGKLLSALSTKQEIKALVFIDDFVGTGSSVSGYLKEVDSEISEIIKSKKIKVVFVAVVACIEGWRQIEKAVQGIEMDVEIHACEILDDSAKCFSEKSSLLKNPNQRQLAMQAAYRYGKVLEPKCPLGYGEMEVAVVFERGCPNNSLPILWSESINPKWIPLFKRL